jgi:hypothetical protein
MKHVTRVMDMITMFPDVRMKTCSMQGIAFPPIRKRTESKESIEQKQGTTTPKRTAEPTCPAVESNHTWKKRRGETEQRCHSSTRPPGTRVYPHVQFVYLCSNILLCNNAILSFPCPDHTAHLLTAPPSCDPISASPLSWIRTSKNQRKEPVGT